MRRHIEEFLGQLAREQNASTNTVSAYRNDLGQFLGFVEGQATPGSANAPEDISRDIIMSYMLNLRQKNYAPATVARKMAAVRAVFCSLAANGTVRENPTEKLSIARVKRNLPELISVQQVHRLLEQPATRSTPEAKRDRAMLELLYATGLRVSELVSLNTNDVNTGARRLHCSDGQRKDRYLNFDEGPAQAVTDYMEAARPRLVQDKVEQALFLNRRGERLTRQGFWQILKGYAKAAGLETDITPRTLRHSIATHLLLSGRMDLNQLSTFLGHANVATTQIYNQMAGQHVRSLGREQL